MTKQVQLNLDPAAAADEAEIRKISASLAGIDRSEITSLRIIEKISRCPQKEYTVNLTIEIFTGGESEVPAITPYYPCECLKEAGKL